MDNFADKYMQREKRQLWEDGTDMSLQQLEDWNAFDQKTKPRVLDGLLPGKQMFYEQFLPPKKLGQPFQQPQQVEPPPQPPAPQPLKSVLKR